MRQSQIEDRQHVVGTEVECLLELHDRVGKVSRAVIIQSQQIVDGTEFSSVASVVFSLSMDSWNRPCWLSSSASLTASYTWMRSFGSGSLRSLTGESSPAANAVYPNARNRSASSGSSVDFYAISCSGCTAVSLLRAVLAVPRTISGEMKDGADKSRSATGVPATGHPV